MVSKKYRRIPMQLPFGKNYLPVLVWTLKKGLIIMVQIRTGGLVRVLRQKCQQVSPVVRQVKYFMISRQNMIQNLGKTVMLIVIAEGILKLLPKPNVDFGGGLERMLIAVENQPDVFQTSSLAPIIKAIEKQVAKSYKGNEQSMRIITDHLVASSFIVLAGIRPSNKDQGYILRRLIRRGYDHFS